MSVHQRAPRQRDTAMTAGFPSLWRPTSDLTTAVLRKVAQRPAVAAMRRLLTCGSALAGVITPSIAHAQTAAAPLRGFDSADVAGYAVLLGSVSAALIFAAVLLRQRNRLDVEVRELRSAFSDSQHKISRYQTLIADKNRRTVIWEGHNGKAELLAIGLSGAK
mgnify:FL=1